MEEYLLLLSGFLAGLVLGLPLGIGISGHRHSVSGIEIKIGNRLARLAARSPKSYSVRGRIVFSAVMLSWLVVFFGALVAPALVARFLGIPDSSPLIGQALRVEYFFVVVGVLAGYLFWTRVAYGR